MFICCVRVAAIVVSEIKDRLSPNIAPPTMADKLIANIPGTDSSKPTASGASATTVPTDVPIESDIKQDVRNNPPTSKLGEI